MARKHMKLYLKRPSVADELLAQVHTLLAWDNGVQYIFCPNSGKTAALLDLGGEHCSDCKKRVRR